MRQIALISGDFTPLGGMDAGNHALADYLASRGDCEVHLIAHRIWHDLAANARVKFHPVRRWANSNLLSAPVLDLVARGVGRRILEQGGRVVVNGGNCRLGDVNWVHYVHAGNPPTIAGAWWRRLHGQLAYRYYLWTERRVVRSAKVVIVNSRVTAAQVVERLGVKPERVKVVYYGCDPARFVPVDEAQRQAAASRFGLPADQPIALFVGALGDRRKGFDSLFEAWSELCAQPDWPAHLAVAGAGGELELWKQRAVDAGLEKRISFLGFRKDIPDLMRCGSVLVHPARYEAYGLAVQEALCAGVPAIVSRAAGVSERYPDELNDLLMEPGAGAAGIRQALLRWQAGQRGLREATGRLSHQLRLHTWDHMAGEIYQLL